MTSSPQIVTRSLSKRAEGRAGEIVSGLNNIPSGTNFPVDSLGGSMQKALPIVKGSKGDNNDEEVPWVPPSMIAQEAHQDDKYTRKSLSGKKSRSGRWLVDRTVSGKHRHDRYNPDIQKIVKVYLPSQTCFKFDIAHSSYGALKLASEKALIIDRKKHHTEDGSAASELTVSCIVGKSTGLASALLSIR